jgi:hypothetical protein
MRDPEALRAFALRDRRVIQPSRDDHWQKSKLESGPAESVRVAEELRAHIRLIHPEWPTPADRRDDLEAHVRVSEALRRVSRRRR